MGTFVTKQTKMSRDRSLIAGIEKHFAVSERVLLEARRHSPAELVEILNERIALSEAVVAAKAAWEEAIRRERENAAKTARLVSALRKSLHLMFGNDLPSLNDFGISPHKERRALSGEEKLIVAAKIRATRAARHTMGKRQKAAITGAITPVIVVTSAPSLPP